MPEMTPETLEDNWIRSPSEWRMWAIDQARQLVDASSDITLAVEDVMQGAQLILWELTRRPKSIDPDMPVSDPDFWKIKRGLV